MPLFSKRPKCPREGQPVTFDPSRSSYFMYRKDACTPKPGARGQTILVATKDGKATCLPAAPGGETVYVRWGNGCIREVWKTDLVGGGGAPLGRVRRKGRRKARR
jgi:hypothetical protein